VEIFIASLLEFSLVLFTAEVLLLAAAKKSNAFAELYSFGKIFFI